VDRRRSELGEGRRWPRGRLVAGAEGQVIPSTGYGPAPRIEKLLGLLEVLIFVLEERDADRPPEAIDVLVAELAEVANARRFKYRRVTRVKTPLP